MIGCNVKMKDNVIKCVKGTHIEPKSVKFNLTSNVKFRGFRNVFIKVLTGWKQVHGEMSIRINANQRCVRERCLSPPSKRVKFCPIYALNTKNQAHAEQLEKKHLNGKQHTNKDHEVLNDQEREWRKKITAALSFEMFNAWFPWHGRSPTKFIPDVNVTKTELFECELLCGWKLYRTKVKYVENKTLFIFIL